MGSPIQDRGTGVAGGKVTGSAARPVRGWERLGPSRAGHPGGGSWPSGRSGTRGSGRGSPDAGGWKEGEREVRLSITRVIGAIVPQPTRVGETAKSSGYRKVGRHRALPRRTCLCTASGVTGVKKLIKLPSVSRTRRERLPHGIVVGFWTNSQPRGVRRWNSASTPATRNSVITVRFAAGRCTPSAADGDQPHRPKGPQQRPRRPALRSRGAFRTVVPDRCDPAGGEIRTFRLDRIGATTVQSGSFVDPGHGNTRRRQPGRHRRDPRRRLERPRGSRRTHRMGPRPDSSRTAGLDSPRTRRSGPPVRHRPPRRPARSRARAGGRLDEHAVVDGLARPIT